MLDHEAKEMHVAKSIATGLMVFAIVLLIDAGIESFADSGRVSEMGLPPIIIVMDGMTPVSSVITGFLAGAVLWSGAESRHLASDLLAILIASLVTIAAITGAVAITRSFHYLDGSRSIPWYRLLLSGIVFIAMSWMVIRNVFENRKTEPVEPRP